MSTTTIRISEELKARVARAAKRAGTTPHAFIVDAIAEKADLAERREDFEQTAELRYSGVADSGMTIPWSEAREYLLQRAKGGKPKKPSPRRLAR